MSLLLSVLLTSVLARPQQAIDAAALYKKSLPSIMRIEVTEPDGARSQGTAFLAIKDGLAVTCWHVVRNAESAKVKFSNGEEFDVSGLIDKDEKRDVALIRVKVADRPFLPFATGDPDVGAKAFAIGSPEGLDFSISDGVISQIREGDGVKYYQFSCPVSHGSSGGPLMNDKGEVLGLVSSGLGEGQNLNFAAPITYVKGLDSTLPTTPWDKVKKDKTSKGTSVDTNSLNQEVADALQDLHRFAVRLHACTEEIMARHEAYPSALFVEQSIRLKGSAAGLKGYQGGGKMQRITDLVSWLCDMSGTVGDRLRSAAVNIDAIGNVTVYVAGFRLVEIDKSELGIFDGPELEGLRKKIGDRILTKLTATKDQKGWRPGEMNRESRSRFVGGYSLLSRLAYDIDSTGYVFGFVVDADDPAKLWYVQGRTPPAEWGFKDGDVFVSVAGKPVKSVEEAKIELIKIGERKTSEVIVKRDNREVKLKVNPSSILHAS